MTANHHPLWRTAWTMSMVVSLFIPLIPWLARGAHGYAAEPQLDITVHQGRLSVYVQDADVRDVLTAIGQQAGITILGNPHLRARVSAQFTGMPLDEGLRRLLRLASLSSTMVYAHGPTGAVVLTAVHVFGEATGPVPHPQLAAEPSAENRREEVGQSFAEALAQISGPLPPPPEVGHGAENDGAARFRALLESAQHDPPPPEVREESELARHFREALEQTLQSPDDTSPRDLPQMEHRE